MYFHTLIQGIDQMLLDFLIFFFVQRIDLSHLLEDCFEVFPYFRDRICDDRKTPLLRFHILVGNPAGLILVLHRKLLLLLGKTQSSLFILRRKRQFPERLHACRSCKCCSLLLQFFIGIPIAFQLVAHKRFVKKQRLVKSVVILKLGVWTCGNVPDF